MIQSSSRTINRSTNQTDNQSIKHLAIKQIIIQSSSNQPIDPSPNNRSLNESSNYSMNQQMTQQINRSNNQTISQSRTINQAKDNQSRHQQFN